jgi:predicted phosphodiesterase
METTSIENQLAAHGARVLLVCSVFGSSFLHSPDARAASSIRKGPWVQRVTSDSAVVRVEVDPPSPVTLELGFGLEKGEKAPLTLESSEATPLHTIPIKGLQPATRYAYSIRVGGSSKSAAFVTAPPDDSDASFRFLVYGDNRTDDAAHAAVVRAMVPAAADFLVHTGDFVEDGASSAHWQTFFDLEAPLLSARCIFSCVGNHELTDGAGIEYTRFFGPTDPPPAVKGAPTRPEHLNGTFRWGNTRFFFINGMVSYKGTVDRTWIEKVLTDADDEKNLKWRVVVVHHGPYSSGPHGNNVRLHDASVVSLLKAHKVDLVISGHDHIYERGWADGLAYVVSGGGGAPAYKIKSKLPQTRKAESVRHFVDVGVSASSMQLVATRSDSSTIERCALGKGVLGWDCDGPNAPAASNASTPAGSTSGASLSPSSSSRCACDAVGAPSPRAALLAVGPLVAGALTVARRRRRIR